MTPRAPHAIAVPGTAAGFAAKAVQAARDHAFTALGLTRVVSYIAPEPAHTRVLTPGMPKTDASQTSKRGD